MILTKGRLNARFARMLRHLEHWGDVEAHDRGASGQLRVFEFQLDTPADGPTEARAFFQERYERTASAGWELVQYAYDYVDLDRRWRQAFHLHPIGGPSSIAHAHCEPGLDLRRDESPRHFRAVEYDLREANALFMRLYADGRSPACDELLPLEIDRG